VKKIICILGIFSLIMGCNKPSEQPDFSNKAEGENAVTCTLKGQSCWEVVQAVGETEIIYPTQEKTCYIYPDKQNLCTYKNPSLEKIKLTVIDFDMYKDGGSRSYTLSDGNEAVRIFIDRKFGSPENGFATISWPDKSSVTFDPKGHLVRQKPAAD